MTDKQPEMDRNVTSGSQSEAAGPTTSTPQRATGQNPEANPSPCLPHSLSLDDFKRGRVLGKGGFGKVRLVEQIGGLNVGKVYAMKSMKMKKVTADKDSLWQTMTECRVLAEVGDSLFLVKSHYTFVTESHLHLVMDYLEGGDLQDLLDKKQKLPEGDVKFYTSEIVLGIDHLHKIDVIHRDLKPANILIDSSGHLRITDYGLSKKFHPRQKPKIAHSDCGGTPHYMAPEVITGEGHTKVVDWWSLGIIVYKMLKGTTPFEQEGDESDEDSNLYKRIEEQDPEIPEEFSDEARDFVERLLTKEPEERLGAGDFGVDDIKRHIFFNNINWADTERKATIAPFVPDLDKDNQNPSSQDSDTSSSAETTSDTQTTESSSEEISSDSQTTEIPAGQTSPAVVTKTPSKKRKLSSAEDDGRPMKRPRSATSKFDVCGCRLH